VLYPVEESLGKRTQVQRPYPGCIRLESLGGAAIPSANNYGQLNQKEGSPAVLEDMQVGTPSPVLRVDSWDQR
jgi:hypothetical protein